MRIDKYLKVSRIIKRRTVASEACEAERVKINGKVAKPSAQVKINDILEITLGQNTLRVRVTALPEQATKQSAVDAYEVVS